MREMRTFMLLETLWQDVDSAARLLRKNPVFAVIAIVTLGLRIGASTAIFSLTYHVLLQLLPVPQPQELVVCAHRVQRWDAPAVTVTAELILLSHV